MSAKDLDMCEYNSQFLAFICMIIADTNSQNKQKQKETTHLTLTSFSRTRCSRVTPNL